MKTQILVLAILFLGGVVFTSCQKDETLNDASVYNMTNADFPKDADTIAPDQIKNYPDPFYHSTTIEYLLEEEAIVTLSVFNENTNLVEQLLQGVRKQEGVHTIIFRAYNQPKGVYIAELNIKDKDGEKVVTEYMKKAGPDTAELDQETVSE